MPRGFAARSESGQMMILMAILLVVLIALVGLVADVGSALVMKSRAQNAGDAASLAAAI